MWVVLPAVAETAALGVGCWFLHDALFEAASAKSILISFIFPALYIALGFFFRPQADVDDLGWFGGMMDNPFSFTDDYNRGLLGLRVLLLPGLLLATPYAIIIRRLAGRDT